MRFALDALVHSITLLVMLKDLVKQTYIIAQEGYMEP